jgi:hypothetical protein
MSAWWLHCENLCPFQRMPRHTAKGSGKDRLAKGVHNAGYPYSATQQDVIFVNGGLQPVIRMAPGVPQLWRIVNAAWKVQGFTLPHCKTLGAQSGNMEDIIFRNAGGLGLDGRSHTHAMQADRLGWDHGPARQVTGIFWHKDSLERPRE